jgi:hypothetical protein
LLHSDLTDQEKISVYNELAREFLTTDADQRLFCKKAFFLSEETGDFSGKAECPFQLSAKHIP